MATPTKLGDKKALGAPSVFAGIVWFQGADNKLWHMPAAHPEKATNPHGLKCLSTPTPGGDGFVYFQDETNSLVMMTQHAPWLFVRFAIGECFGPPNAPVEGVLYFKTTNSNIAALPLQGGERGRVKRLGFRGSLTCDFQPTAGLSQGLAAIFYVTGETLMRASPFGGGINPKTVTSGCGQDCPYLGRNGKVYTVGLYSGYEIDVQRNRASRVFGGARSTPTPTRWANDGRIYWRHQTDDLCMALEDEPSSKYVLGKTKAWPYAPGDGYLYFLGMDDYLYRVSNAKPT